MDWSAEFPGLAHGTYLNTSAYGLLPRRTRAAVDAHMDQWATFPDWDVWNETIEQARRGFARLIGAREDEIAIQANASSSIAAVMNALPQSGKKHLVTCDIDFPTAPFLAERQATRGFSHDHIRTRGGLLRAPEYAEHLTRDTALACIPSIASFNGYRFDIDAFTEAAHAKGVPLLVDAFQGAGTYPIDVRKTDVDFLVTGVYKWLLGPVGLAFLYVRRDHHDLLPTTAGWYGAKTPYAFDPMEGLAPNAQRFQYGGANVMGCAAASASFDLLHEVGIANIERHDRALVERVMAHADDRKYEVLTPRDPAERASIVNFRVPHLERALDACKREKIAINTRLNGIRVAPHFYNTEADIDRLFEVLDTVA